MKVVHCKRDGFDVYVGRPTVWGNPFKLGEHESRGATIERYERWLKTQHALVARAQRELKGKILSCWCAPKGGVDSEAAAICHAQILARVANA